MKERGADMEEQPQAWIIEQLDMPIRYINGQWAVTGYGIECITSPYEIKKADLADARWGDATMPQWPRHMAKINWVNTDKFLDAFEAALKAHNIKHSFRPDWKEATRERTDEDRARWARDPSGWFEAIVHEW
jgi:hypothetical protein